MRLGLRKTITLVAAAGFLGFGFASPAAADGWGWGGHHGWGHRGWDDGGAAAAAALGGFALGAVAGAASQPGYGYGGYGGYGGGYGYGDCYYVDRPVADGWGNIVAYRRAQVCE